MEEEEKTIKIISHLFYNFKTKYNNYNIHSKIEMTIIQNISISKYLGKICERNVGKARGVVEKYFYQKISVLKSGEVCK